LSHHSSLADQQRLPYRHIGPQFDYLGAVARYSMNLMEFEAGARSGRFPLVADFVYSIDTRDEARHDANGSSASSSLSTVMSQLLSADA